MDDVTGQPLPPEVCREARRAEIEHLRSKCASELKQISEALRITGRRPISVRWAEVNKGDSMHPKIRSRLVACLIRGPGQEACFAPRPPLESSRMILSCAVTQIEGEEIKTWYPNHEERMQLLLDDISREYVAARADPSRPTYVELPPVAEAPEQTCARLRRHVYGTQRAAEGWQDEYSSAYVSLGFLECSASSCVFRHPAKNITPSVHVDDFTAAGPKNTFDGFEARTKQRYELTVGGRLGPVDGDRKEALILNRIVRRTDTGLEYKADPRQGEKLLHEILLDDRKKGCVTPGVKIAAHQVEQDTPLNGRVLQVPCSCRSRR